MVTRFGGVLLLNLAMNWFFKNISKNRLFASLLRYCSAYLVHVYLFTYFVCLFLQIANLNQSLDLLSQLGVAVEGLSSSGE